MKSLRPLAESLLLHLLLVGGVCALATGAAGRPAIVRLDFSLAAEPETAGLAQENSAMAKVAPRTLAPAAAPAATSAVKRSPTPPPARSVTHRPEAAPVAERADPVIPEPAGEQSSPDLHPQPVGEAGSAEDAAFCPESECGEQAVAATSAGSAPDAGADVQHAAAAAYRQVHFGAIHSAILSRLRYPESARRKGLTGLVEVSFLVDRQGAVSELRVQTSSGHSRLDRAVLEAIRSASPFPPPPVVAQLSIPIRFALN